MTHIDVSKINWKLLREQKLALVEMDEIGPELQGILNLVDHIQDEAEKELGGEVIYGDPSIEVVVDLQSFSVDVSGEFLKWPQRKQEQWLQARANNHKPQIEGWEQID